MSELGTQRAHSRHSSDWNRSWEEISGLPSTQEPRLPHATDGLKLDQAAAALATPSAALDVRPEQPPQPSEDFAPDQLARGMAEIEQAAVALRREEPRLEPEAPGYEAKAELHSARSVWILIAVIWVSVASAVSCAIGAALLLFG